MKQLFVANLFRMYTRYAERHNWKVEAVSENETDIGDFRRDLYLWLKEKELIAN